METGGENPWGAGGLHLRGRSERYDRALDWFDAGDLQASLNLLTEALAESDSDPFLRRMILFRAAEVHARLGRLALEAGETAEALSHLSSAVELHPQYPDLNYLLALAKYTDGDLVSALESVDLAIEYNPVFWRARILRGALLYTLGQSERAIPELESALRLQPGAPFVADALAAHEAGDSRGAIKSMARAVTPGASEVEQHQQQGEEHFRHGRYEEAAAEYLRALDLSPTYADIHNKLGVTLAAAGRRSHALDSFAKALEYNPTYVDAWINRGVLLLELGQSSDASHAFQRALELDPENEVAQSKLRRSDETEA